jgi:hypothetical protein
MFRLDKLRCDEMQPLISLMQFIFAFDFKTALASIRKKHIGERAGLTRSVDLSDMSTGKNSGAKNQVIAHKGAREGECGSILSQTIVL